MEAKDWFTLLTSWAALGVAGYSLWVTLRRDKREEEAGDPLINMDLHYENNAPWCRGRITIESRQDARMIIKRLEIISPNSALILIDPINNDKDEYLRSIPINVELDKGQNTSVNLYIVVERVPAIHFRFELVIVTMGHVERERRFTITRTITA
jgi:hypothetical protein